MTSETRCGFAMIAVAALSGALTGCDLYFGSGDDADTPPADARPRPTDAPTRPSDASPYPYPPDAGVVSYVSLASGLDRPARVVVDDSHVYWVNMGSGRNGSVMRVGKAGGLPQLLASDQASPVGLVVDAEAVYWTNFGINGGEGGVMRVIKSGGTPVPLATGLSEPRELAGDDAYVYWTERTAGVKRIAKRGGLIELLAKGQVISGAIAVDKQRVYFNDVLAARLRSVPKAGGAVTDVAMQPYDISNLETDGQNLYWCNGGGDSLMQVSAAGGVPGVLFAAGYEMRQCVVTPTTLFILQLGPSSTMPFGAWTIHQLDRATRTDKLIAPSESGNWAIAVDNRFVYWTNFFRGTVNTAVR